MTGLYMMIKLVLKQMSEYTDPKNSCPVNEFFMIKSVCQICTGFCYLATVS